MKRNQKGFTLMELMVVIVIVAILAAVAVPLYINYVRDASRTEAKGAIGAIITAEQTYNQQFGHYIGFADADIPGWLVQADPALRLNCDITDARQNWTFDCDASDPAIGFRITSTGIAGRPTAGLGVQYILHPGQGVAQWAEQ
jgi:prepilin-type N-terminal cleavage/methylation domain-containing protein